jgi:NADH-quinone oxidoreductase subunit N
VKVSGTDWFLLSPELFLTSAGLLLLALAPVFRKGHDEFVGFLAFLFVGVTAVLLAIVSAHPARKAGPILAGMFVVDNFAIFFKFALLLTIALTILASIAFIESAPYPAVEYFALLLFSGVGMLFMVSDEPDSIYGPWS